MTAAENDKHDRFLRLYVEHEEFTLRSSPTRSF